MIEVILFIISSFFLVTLSIWLLCQPKNKKAPKIPYKIFSVSYNINPERWKYDTGDLYFIDGSFKGKVRYSYIDWWRLKFFFRRINKTNNKACQNHNYELILLTIQKDVKNEIDKSNSEIEEANKMMKDIIERKS